jgi:hypothetical protein
LWWQAVGDFSTVKTVQKVNWLIFTSQVFSDKFLAFINSRIHNVPNIVTWKSEDVILLNRLIYSVAIY